MSRRFIPTVLRAQCSTAVAIALCSQHAVAFKEPGHRAIEAAAYRQLLERDRETRAQCESRAAARSSLAETAIKAPSAIAAGGPCEGVGTIERLVAYGVLKPPARPKRVDESFEDYTVEGLVVHSHMPDHTMERQFHRQRQCFHFNASGGHYVADEASRFSPKSGSEGVPQGLVEDAYVECVGVAESLLRATLFDPVGSREQEIGIYNLMHMLADSFSEAHVARTRHGEILYLKPWNIRTWLRYGFLLPNSTALHDHFSDRHHQTADSVRDLGYLIGPKDADFEYRLANEPPYRVRMDQCLADVRLEHGLKYMPVWDDLYTEMVVPPSCLSDSANAAVTALVDLLVMVADLVPNVRVPTGSAGGTIAGKAEFGSPFVTQTRVADGLAARWLTYRLKHLRHVSEALTTRLSIRPFRPLSTPSTSAYETWNTRLGFDTHGDIVYPSEELNPRSAATAAYGFATEVTTNNPLWIGYDSFVSGESTSSHSLGLGNFLGWGAQVRLPLEDENRRRPIGLALDMGFVFPGSISHLIAGDLEPPVAVYLGARGRVEYSVSAVFDATPRHVLQYGFGGVNLDVVVGKFWASIDFPKVMWEYDLWVNRDQRRDVVIGISAGVVTGAFYDR